MDAATFNRLLAAAAKGGASDIHFKTDVPPSVRIHGVLTPVKCPALAADDMKRIATHIVSQGRQSMSVDEILDKDTSYTVEGVARFRVNLYRQKGELAAVLRVIHFGIPTCESLGLPESVRKIAESERGLILVTGVTGSGKSSTLAAMIGHINGIAKKHILTIEDPIEFIHTDKLCRVSQREVGIDTPSFTLALRAALRQDPDVILVGELRDHETVDIALKAAETGHLVFATVHTADAANTISRIIGAFPPETQHTVRLRLAEALKATISQRLLSAAEGKGRVVACEILVSTISVQTMIKEPSKMGHLAEYLKEGADVYGTQSFDQHLLKLLKEGKITRDTAIGAATSPGDVLRELELGG